MPAHPAASLSIRNQAVTRPGVRRSNAHILVRHVLPNVVAPLLVLISMNVGWMITETAGSVRGLGAQPPQTGWGSMLRTAGTSSRLLSRRHHPWDRDLIWF
jgi:peptide/nickel transport system permease protein